MQLSFLDACALPWGCALSLDVSRYRAHASRGLRASLDVSRYRAHASRALALRVGLAFRSAHCRTVVLRIWPVITNHMTSARLLAAKSLAEVQARSRGTLDHCG